MSIWCSAGCVQLHSLLSIPFAYLYGLGSHRRVSVGRHLQESLVLPLLRAGPALKLDQLAQGLVHLSLDTSKDGEVLNPVSGHALVQDHLHDGELSSFVLLEFAVLQLMPIALHPPTKHSRKSLAASSPNPSLRQLDTAARYLLHLLF